MPNGGSDCCATCWFNAKNKGEAGYEHMRDPEPDHCRIRDLAIDDPFYTYCPNHPHRNPERLDFPVGPVYVGESSGERWVWRRSPDTPELRERLRELADQITGESGQEYPGGASIPEAVVWQLGDWQDRESVPVLERIAAMDLELDRPDHGTPAELFWRPASAVVGLAREALEKISG